jgi:hypothetical protein
MSIVEDIEKLILEVERRPPLYNKKLKEYSDRNLKDKLWYEVYESSRTGVSFQLNRNQKKMLIFLFILLGIMLIMLIYTG